MNWLVQNAWLIPALPLLAAGVTALTPQSGRRFAATTAISALAVSLVLSCSGFLWLMTLPEGQRQLVQNFDWFESGTSWVMLGWVFEPLTALLLVMVCFVGLVIFTYSTGYMAQDRNFTRFFCFLSLFAGAMLGLLLANSLLLLFICWELVGLTSFLLIGFWYEKPSAVAAAQKAFITTRVGDLALFLGMLWLYAESGTLLFYSNGAGCLEHASVAYLAGKSTAFLGLGTSTAIVILVFLGACGKSGQVPFHVWLPDAMEGPTPVSALIHAATMVAAGVFLMARIYPLAAADASLPDGFSMALAVVAWTGAITAFIGASIAVAQTDMKRILAYSTVSQLGYMMIGLATGGVAVGIFHLVTHAVFKALLFLGAGSVIHGCAGEQDIRNMGGLRKYMPWTFATYVIGMLSLCGFPLLFSGFWSKDAILHSAELWKPSHGPFILGVAGVFLTAFYMTRQLILVFFGRRRLSRPSTGAHPHCEPVHESPLSMIGPLCVLAVLAVLVGFLGTPMWPWLQSFVEQGVSRFEPGELVAPTFLVLTMLSSIIVVAMIGAGYWLYGRQPLENARAADPLERLRPDIYWLLKNRYFFDEVYAWSLGRLIRGWCLLCERIDCWGLGLAVQAVAYVTVCFSWAARFFEQYVINSLFDRGCGAVAASGKKFSLVQRGQVQVYLRIMAAALVLLLLLGLMGGI